MSVLKFNLHHHYRHRPNIRPLEPHFLSLTSREQTVKVSPPVVGPLCFSTKHARNSKINAATSFSIGKNKDEEEIGDFEEYLAEDGAVYQKTLRLVECAMFAAVSALAFLLSNSLAIEVATTVLLFVLSGPVKAITYLLLHGFLGFVMGTLWRSKANWRTSVSLCAIVRAIGALANVVIASYLIGENILALITINVHALVTFILSSIGIIAVPSMNLIYFIFGFLLLLNCGFFVFLLHLLYAIFFTRLGLKAELRLPKWLEAAI